MPPRSTIVAPDGTAFTALASVCHGAPCVPGLASLPVGLTKNAFDAGTWYDVEPSGAALVATVGDVACDAREPCVHAAATSNKPSPYRSAVRPCTVSFPSAKRDRVRGRRNLGQNDRVDAANDVNDADGVDPLDSERI